MYHSKLNELKFDIAQNNKNHQRYLFDEIAKNQLISVTKTKNILHSIIQIGRRKQSAT